MNIMNITTHCKPRLLHDAKLTPTLKVVYHAPVGLAPIKRDRAGLPFTKPVILPSPPPVGCPPVCSTILNPGLSLPLVGVVLA